MYICIMYTDFSDYVLEDIHCYINNCYVCTNSYKMTLLKYARKARTDLIWP